MSLTALADSMPLLLNARQAGMLAGYSEAQINALVREGVIPDEVIHPAGRGGWRKFSKVQLLRWLDDPSTVLPRHEAAS